VCACLDMDAGRARTNIAICLATVSPWVDFVRSLACRWPTKCLVLGVWRGSTLFAVAVKNMAHARLICSSVRQQELDPDDGAMGLETHSRTLTEHAAAEMGRWEASPGCMEEVEADEVFLILAGSGTLTFEDDSIIELRPGVLVRLIAGDRTTWKIASRIRQLHLS
jgi:uncharacterized protein